MIDTRHDLRFVLMRQINRLMAYWPVGDSIGRQFKIAERLLPPPSGMTKIRTIMGFDIIVDAKNRSGFIDWTGDN